MDTSKMASFLSLPKILLLAACAFALGQLRVSAADVPKWQRYEIKLESVADYGNPVQEAQLAATFTSPKGEMHKVYGFWDGGKTWRIRFLPDETGRWKYK